MRVFNLAEELEKERKKNEELEERINSAISYIERTREDVDWGNGHILASYDLDSGEIRDLLNILGDNNE